MGLKVNDVLTITLSATLAGAPGSFEGAPTITAEPAGLVGDIVVAADNLSATAPVLAAGDVTISVTVDNLEGEPVGILTGTATATLLPADPVVTADALEVSVS